MSNVFTDTFAWLADPLHWSGSMGIPVRLVEHLQYTGLVMLIATAIAVPIGLYVGHTGRGGWRWWPWPAPCGRCPRWAC